MCVNLRKNVKASEKLLVFFHLQDITYSHLDLCSHAQPPSHELKLIYPKRNAQPVDLKGEQESHGNIMSEHFLQQTINMRNRMHKRNEKMPFWAFLMPSALQLNLQLSRQLGRGIC